MGPVLLGPSGVGKTTTRRILQGIDPRFVVIPAWTTRPARPNDVDRIHVTEEQFTREVQSDSFLPANVVFGARYATPRAPITEALAAGQLPVMDWPVSLLGELRAALDVRLFCVYIKPPSIHELRRRLGLDDRAADTSRLGLAMEELIAIDRTGLPCGIDFAVTSTEGNASVAASNIYEAFINSFGIPSWSDLAATRVPVGANEWHDAGRMR
jgi:guanylate kinase